MKLYDILSEALKPSEYRKYVKGWDKSKYADVFKKYTTDKKGYRIYLPFEGKKKILTPYPILNALAKKGYTVEDYGLGIAVTDDGKRRIKIGKLLADEPELLKKFQEDPQRRGAKNQQYLVVISRHPYDIAGMSTDRGWTSCMNLKDGINRKYVYADVKEGTLVAYLIDADDKNINKPVCRVLIKPFFEVNKTDKPQHVLLGIEDSVYGTNVEGFTKVVQRWVDDFNDKDELDGVFALSDKLYNDSGTYNTEKYKGKAAEIMKYIEDDPRAIEKYPDATPQMYAKAAVMNPKVLASIGKKPTEWIVKLIQIFGEMREDDSIVIQNPDNDPDDQEDYTWDDLIKKIPREDDDVLIAIVDNFGPALIGHMRHVSDRVIDAMFDRWSFTSIFRGYGVRGFPNKARLWECFIKKVKKMKRIGGHTWDSVPAHLLAMKRERVKIPEEIAMELLEIAPQSISDMYYVSDALLKRSVELDPDWLRSASSGEFDRDKYFVPSYNQTYVKKSATELLDRAKKLGYIKES